MGNIISRRERDGLGIRVTVNVQQRSIFSAIEDLLGDAGRELIAGYGHMNCVHGVERKIRLSALAWTHHNLGGFSRFQDAGEVGQAIGDIQLRTPMCAIRVPGLPDGRDLVIPSGQMGKAEVTKLVGGSFVRSMRSAAAFH